MHPVKFGVRLELPQTEAGKNWGGPPPPPRTAYAYRLNSQQVS